jgi:hypothetical protein
MTSTVLDVQEDDLNGAVLGIERQRNRRLSGINPIVRSVPVHRILHRGAEKFGSSKGVAADYELSAPTEWIDFFLSHSWRAPRMAKFFTLWMFFRLPAATLGAVVCSALAFALSVSEALPPMQPNITDRFADLNPGGSPGSCWASIFGFAGFFVGGMLQGLAERFSIVKNKGCFLECVISPAHAAGPIRRCAKSGSSLVLAASCAFIRRTTT